MEKIYAKSFDKNPFLCYATHEIVRGFLFIRRAL